MEEIKMTQSIGINGRQWEVSQDRGKTLSWVGFTRSQCEVVFYDDNTFAIYGLHFSVDYIPDLPKLADHAKKMFEEEKK
jgi:hypothetical protein